MELDFKSARWMQDDSGVWLSLLAAAPSENRKAREFCSSMKPDKLYTAKLDVKRNKRSSDANRYFHLLVNKIARVIRSADDAVKKELVLKYGAVMTDENGGPVGIKLPVSVNVGSVYPYTKWFDTRTENGVEFNCYILYKQTHTLNTHEMYQLISGAVDDAQELGIDTRTPDEIAKMMIRYEEEYAKQTDKSA